MSIVIEIRGYKRFVLNREKVKIIDIYRELGLSIEEFVPIKNGRIVTEYDEVESKDKLVLYPVSSIG